MMNICKQSLWGLMRDLSHSHGQAMLQLEQSLLSDSLSNGNINASLLLK
jgi:hypothetical protein